MGLVGALNEFRGLGRPRARCPGPWGEGKGVWGGCKYVVGVVEKPSAAWGPEAAK